MPLVRSAPRPRSWFRALGAATVIGALALAGCSATPAAKAGSSGSATTKGGNLTVWFPGTNQTEIDLVTKTIVPAFEKDTGATVQVTYVDWGNLSTKLNAAFAAGTAPDVFGHGPAAVADFVVNKRIVPLDNYVATMSADDRKDLAAVLPGGQVGGKQYLMPLSMLGDLIMYNAADFKAAGLNPDAPPTSWQQLATDAEALTVRDASGKITRSGLLLPSQAIGRQQTFASLLLSAGGSQLSADNKKAAFNSEQGVKALDYFASLYSGDHAVSAGLGADYINAPTAQQPIVLGTAAMTLQTPNAMNQIIAANPGLDLRVMDPLTFQGSSKGYFLGGAGPGLMINADSRQKDLAWKFISYFLTPAVSAQYTEGIGAVPARASAAKTPYVAKNPVLSTFVRDADAFVPNPNVAGWIQIRDTMDKFIEQALNGKMSSKDALDQAAAAVDKILAANG